ncbi:MAG: 1-acyl-sn-glycerol-3-phosphate acyltransferase [Chlamydiota bacterium]
MEKKSKSSCGFAALKHTINTLVEKDHIPVRYGKIFTNFFTSYHTVLTEQGKDFDSLVPLFQTFLKSVQEQFASPYQFKPIHHAIRSPFDYYQLGIDLLLPLVDLPASTASGLDHLQTIVNQLDQRENIILFANHQIEADPQAISILLQNHAPAFAENLFFVAGTRVTSDPLAIPFSMGRNLICIHSKKYISTPPEKQHEKQLHNKRTLGKMVTLLDEGGHAIYVAPSGGRDRVDETGNVAVAPFDPQSIELFYLMTKKAQRRTHFYPLALSTHHLLPPPETTEIEIGESRITRGSAIHLQFGAPIDMEDFPGSEKAHNKKDKKALRTHFIWNQVKNDYAHFPE